MAISRLHPRNLSLRPSRSSDDRANWVTLRSNSERKESAPDAPGALLPLSAFVFCHPEVFLTFKCDLALLPSTRPTFDSFEGREIGRDKPDGGYSIRPDRVLVWRQWIDPKSGEWKGKEETGTVFDFFSEDLEIAIGEFSTFVRSGDIRVWGRWNSMREPLEPIDRTLWPANPLVAAEAGKIDFARGTWCLPSGETIYSMSVEFVAPEPIVPPKTAKGKTEFEREVRRIMELSPYTKTKTVEEFKKQARDLGVSEQGVRDIRAKVLSELEEKHPGITGVWTKEGRPPSIIKKSPR